MQSSFITLSQWRSFGSVLFFIHAFSLTWVYLQKTLHRDWLSFTTHHYLQEFRWYMIFGENDFIRYDEEIFNIIICHLCYTANKNNDNWFALHYNANEQFFYLRGRAVPISICSIWNAFTSFWHGVTYQITTLVLPDPFKTIQLTYSSIFKKTINYESLHEYWHRLQLPDDFRPYLDLVGGFELHISSGFIGIKLVTRCVESQEPQLRCDSQQSYTYWPSKQCSCVMGRNISDWDGNDGPVVFICLTLSTWRMTPKNFVTLETIVGLP